MHDEPGVAGEVGRSCPSAGRELDPAERDRPSTGRAPRPGTRLASWRRLPPRAVAGPHRRRSGSALARANQPVAVDEPHRAARPWLRTPPTVSTWASVASGDSVSKPSTSCRSASLRAEHLSVDNAVRGRRRTAPHRFDDGRAQREHQHEPPETAAGQRRPGEPRQAGTPRRRRAEQSVDQHPDQHPVEIPPPVPDDARPSTPPARARTRQERPAAAGPTTGIAPTPPSGARWREPSQQTATASAGSSAASSSRAADWSVGVDRRSRSRSVWIPAPPAARRCRRRRRRTVDAAGSC